MAANILFSTLLMGLVLLAMVALVIRGRPWRRAEGRADGGSSFDVIAAALRSPTAWMIVFLLLVLVSVAGSLALVGAVPLPEGTQPLVTTALLAGAGIVLGGFVFFGTYASVRGRGYGSAPAVGLGSLAVGLAALVVVVLQLFLG